MGSTFIVFDGESTLNFRNLFQIFLPKIITTINKMIAAIPAMIGEAIAKKLIIPAPAVSVVATTEFPKPPVVAVEAALVPANPELIAAAVPPPAVLLPALQAGFSGRA